MTTLDFLFSLCFIAFVGFGLMLWLTEDDHDIKRPKF